MKNIFKKSGILLMIIAISIVQTLSYMSFAHEDKESYPILENYLKSKVKMEAKNNKNEKVRVIIELDEKNENQAKYEISKIPGVKIHYTYDNLLNGVSIDIPSDSISKLNSIEGVKKVKKSEKLIPQMFNSREITKVIQSKAKYSNKYGLDGRGMLIATIDSGVDINHPDMRIDDDAIKDMKIKEKDIKPPFTNKVPFGYNYFKSEKENLKGIDGQPHGMHIAGILAGNSPNKDGFKGIAPNAQLLVYKVITYDRKGPDADSHEIEYIGEDAQYHAMEDAISKGADIISLSIGDFGSGSSDDVWESVVRKCHEKGVVVVAAMGNRSASNSESSYDSVADVAFERKDTSSSVSVAANRNVIGVGSTRNTYLRLPSVKINDMNFAYSNLSRFNDNIVPQKNRKNLPDKEISSSFVFAKRGMNEEILQKSDVEGKVVVLLRGGEAIKEKVNRFLDKGARGVIVLNYLSDYSRGEYKDQPIIGNEHLSIDKGWAISMSYNDGMKLLEKVKNNKELKIKFDPVARQTKIANTSLISGFSSWGPNYDLEMKPDMVAPGENIYSTGNGGTYKIMSGTSMASPNIAGISTLLLSKTRNIKDANINKINVSDLTKIMLMNTANILQDYGKLESGKILPYSPRRQGAGLVDLDKALETDVLITYDGNKGAASLKEIEQIEKFTLKLINFSDKEKSFDIEPLEVMTQKTSPRHIKDDYQEITSGTAHETVINGAKINGPSAIVIQPHSTTNVSFTLNTGEAKNQFVEGYIRFVSKENDQPTLNIPYMGFKGKWAEENILDKPQWESESITKLSRLQKYLKYDDHKGEFIFEQLGKKDKNGVDDPSTYYINSIRDGRPNYITEVKKVAPSIVFLRETNQFDVSIVDKKDDNIKPLRVINKGYYPEKYMDNSFKEFGESYQKIFKNIDPNAIWDGGVYNPKSSGGGWESSWFKAAPEGQYYYRIRAKKSERDPWECVYMPIKVDNTKPSMTTTYDKSSEKVTVHLHDNEGIEYVGATINGKFVHMRNSGRDKYEIDVPNDEITKQTLRIEAMDYAGNPISNETDLNDRSLLEKEDNVKEDNVKDNDEEDNDSASETSEDNEVKSSFDPRSITSINGHFINHDIGLKHNLVNSDNLNDIKYEVGMSLSGNQRAVITNTNTHWNWVNKEKDQYKPLDILELNAEEDEGYIKIKEGDNYIKIRVYDGDKVVYDNKYTVYMDINAPTIEFGDNISLEPVEEDSDESDGTSTTRNGLIYSNSKQGTVYGIVQDNLDKYVVRINGDVVKRAGLKGHFGPEHNRTNFKYDYSAIDGEFVHIVLEDSSGNSKTFELKVKIDDEKPVINLKNENLLTSDSILNYDITDNIEDDNKEYNVTTIVTVNGKEYRPGTKLKDYDVIGKEGNYNIAIIAMDLAGNKTFLEKKVEKEHGAISSVVIPELKKEMFTKDEIKNINNIFNLNNGIKAKVLEYGNQTKHNVKIKVEFSNEFGVKKEKEYTLKIVEEDINQELDKLLDRELKQTEFSMGTLTKYSQLFDLSDGANVIIKNKIDASNPGEVTFKAKFTKDNKYFEREYKIKFIKYNYKLKKSQIKLSELDNLDNIIDTNAPNKKFVKNPVKKVGEQILEIELSDNNGFKTEIRLGVTVINDSVAPSPNPGFVPSPQSPADESLDINKYDEISVEKTIRNLKIPVERVSGKTRIQTAVMISKKTFKKADNVVIVSDKSNSDALTSALFAKDKDAPILLTDTNKLSIDTENEVNRLGAKNIYIVGGEKSISKTIVRKFKDKRYNVVRISGKDRYKTSQKLLDQVNIKNKENIFIVNGRTEIDSVAISPISAKRNMPILLTNGIKIDNDIMDKVKKYKDRTVIGGTASISESLQRDLNAKRVGGRDRFDTSVQIRNKYLKDSKNIFIASGINYVDCLTGAVYAAKNDASILLVKKNQITDDVKTALESANNVIILGGRDSVR